MNKPDDVSQEGLMDFFEDGYAGFYLKEGDYTDVIIDGHYDLDALAQSIARAIMAARLQERENTLRIMEAEREWGSDLVEAYERIRTGQGPRQISGWNAPSEE